MSERTVLGPEAAPATVAWHRILLLLVLAFGYGAADAFAFLEVGGVFTANQTGNLVLVALVGRADYAVVAMGAGVTFTAGAYAGFRATRVDAAGLTGREAETLAACIVLQAAVVALWWAFPRAGGQGIRLAMLALASAALGARTAVARRSETHLGLTTTYVTGTITSVMESLADRKRSGILIHLTAVVLLVFGSLVGAPLSKFQPAITPWCRSDASWSP